MRRILLVLAVAGLMAVMAASSAAAQGPPVQAQGPPVGGCPASYEPEGSDPGGSFPSKLCYREHLWSQPTRPWTRMAMDIPASSSYTRARAHEPLGTITLSLAEGYNPLR